MIQPSWHQRTRRVVALMTLSAFLTACYAQTPLRSAVPAPQTRIIAELTDSGVVTMGNAIGAGAMEVEGVVSDADAATWRLHLVRVEHRGGTSTTWNRELVSFPRSALTNARERRLDKTRSWLAAGAVAAAVALVAAVFGSALGGGGPDDGSVNPS